MKKTLILLSLYLTLGFKTENKVLICVSSGARKYHTHYCQGLKKCIHQVEEVSVKEANNRGYTPCGYCY